MPSTRKTAPKHSPTPWAVEPENCTARRGSFSIEIVDPDSRVVAYIYGTDAEACANARLIAAAPKMYDALHSLWAVLEHHAHWKPEMPAALIRELSAVLREIDRRVT